MSFYDSDIDEDEEDTMLDDLVQEALAYRERNNLSGEHGDERASYAAVDTLTDSQVVGLFVYAPTLLRDPFGPVPVSTALDGLKHALSAAVLRRVKQHDRQLPHA